MFFLYKHISLLISIDGRVPLTIKEYRGGGVREGVLKSRTIYKTINDRISSNILLDISLNTPNQKTFTTFLLKKSNKNQKNYPEITKPSLLKKLNG